MTDNKLALISSLSRLELRVRGDAFDLVKHSISVPSDLLAETFHFSES